MCVAAREWGEEECCAMRSCRRQSLLLLLRSLLLLLRSLLLLLR